MHFSTLFEFQVISDQQVSSIIAKIEMLAKFVRTKSYVIWKQWYVQLTSA